MLQSTADFKKPELHVETILSDSYVRQMVIYELKGKSREEQALLLKRSPGTLVKKQRLICTRLNLTHWEQIIGIAFQYGIINTNEYLNSSVKNNVALILESIYNLTHNSTNSNTSLQYKLTVLLHNFLELCKRDQRIAIQKEANPYTLITSRDKKNLTTLWKQLTKSGPSTKINSKKSRSLVILMRKLSVKNYYTLVKTAYLLDLLDTYQIESYVASKIEYSANELNKSIYNKANTIKEIEDFLIHFYYRFELTMLLGYQYAIVEQKSA